MELNVPQELRDKVVAIAAEFNEFIRKGKWEVFNDDAKQLIDRWGLNDLLFMGCKYHKLPTTYYLELPYKELEEKDINSILFTLSKLQTE